MIKTILNFLIAILFVNLCNAQNLANAFAKDGKIFISYDNNNTKKIVSTGNNSVIAFSRAKNFVLYKRIEQYSKTKGEEGGESSDQLSICVFTIKSNKETVLFTTCLDGVGGTQPDYAHSNIYPNNNLCGFELPMLTTDGERLFFQTDGWAVCPAIHYYNFKTNKLVFYKAGWLQKVTAEGVKVKVTGFESKNNQEYKGRYTQNCLFDINGKLIKKLTPKEF